MTPQQHFEETYITTREICARMHVTRAAVSHAIARKEIPGPHVQMDSDKGVFLWLRVEIEPFLNAWAVRLNERRSNPARAIALCV